jgi:hypothetical protein
MSWNHLPDNLIGVLHNPESNGDSGDEQHPDGLIHHALPGLDVTVHKVAKHEGQVQKEPNAVYNEGHQHRLQSIECEHYTRSEEFDQYVSSFLHNSSVVMRVMDTV